MPHGVSQCASLTLLICNIHDALSTGAWGTTVSRGANSSNVAKVVLALMGTPESLMEGPRSRRTLGWPENSYFRDNHKTFLVCVWRGGILRWNLKILFSFSWLHLKIYENFKGIKQRYNNKLRWCMLLFIPSPFTSAAFSPSLWLSYSFIASLQRSIIVSPNLRKSLEALSLRSASWAIVSSRLNGLLNFLKLLTNLLI